MRGKYKFDDLIEQGYWFDRIKVKLQDWLNSDSYKLDLTQEDISPNLLGEILKLLGYEEDYGEFDKECLWVTYSNGEIRLGLQANVEVFSLKLYRLDEEETY